MNLNRRNVLAGLGAAAVGTGAAFGSGAFTSVEAEREVTVTTAGDDAAAIMFDSGSEDVEGVENSQLTIDLEGVNEDSTIWLGESDEDSEVSDAAFIIENNTDDSDNTHFDNEVSVEISADEHLEATDASIEFHADDGSNYEELTSDPLTLDGGDDAQVAVEIEIGEAEIGTQGESEVTFTAEVVNGD